MIIFINGNGEIKDVGTNSLHDESLTEVEVDDKYSPFKTFSKAKICCYKVNVVDGIVMMMTPYVDSRLIDHIDQLGKYAETNASNVDYLAMMLDVDVPTEDEL